MTPRFTLLIIVGIVVYVSLSLYHWRQVKKIPGAERPNSVHSVLAGDSRTKNWVQVSTSPGRADESTGNTVPPAPAIESAPGTEQPAPGPLPETPPAEEDTPVDSASRELRAFRDENNELRNSLQHEQSLNQRHVQEINDLHAQLLALRSAGDAPGPGSEDSGAEENKIQNLKTFLAAKTEALAKANARITGLAERLDQSRRSLAEAENSNIYLQSVLSQTENAGAKARQEAGRLHEELVRTREDRKKYLAETGRLHSRLQQANIRLAGLESELNKARRTSEAMLRYGKAQTELVVPFRRQIEIINARVEDQKGALLTAEDEISQLLDRERLLQDQVQVLQLEVQQNKGSAEKLHETSQALESAQQHSAKLTEQLKVLADQLNAGEAEISRLSRSLAEAQTAAQDAMLRADNLKTETQQRQQHLEAELEETRRVNQQLNEKITEQGQQLQTARAETVHLTAGLQETGDRLAETAAALQRSQTEFKQLMTTQQAAVQTNSIEADQTISQLRSALDIAQSRLTETDAALQRLKESPAPAGPTDETAARLQQELDRLRQTLADKGLQQQNAERIATELKNENRLLREKITAAELESANTVELESALEQKSRELNEVKDRIAMLEKEGAGLRSELERRERAVSKMREEQASLQDRVDSLQRERDTLLPYTLDSDNDTISDANDRCPGTVQGAEVGPDGCERDRDLDGVVDRLDLCPESPENADTNRFGCAGGEPIVLSGIFFSGGNAELSPAARSYLDKVAEVLEFSADSRFEVAGHTDSIGEAARNLIVSRQRSEAVTDYLVKKGIAAGRLVAAGYGADQPVADNATAEGRAANRRVELKILPPGENTAPAGEEEPVTAAEEEGLPVRSENRAGPQTD